MGTGVKRRFCTALAPNDTSPLSPGSSPSRGEGGGKCDTPGCPFSKRSSFLRHQCIDKGVGVEFLQILYVLADADVSNGQAGLFRDGDEDTTFRGPVELAEHEPRDAPRRSEMLQRRECVLTRTGV